MSKITISVKALRAVAPFVSQEETRYYLNGVLFHDKLLVATDGHRMAVINPLQFVGSAKEDFILPHDTIKKVCGVKCWKRQQTVLQIDTAKWIAQVFVIDRSLPIKDLPQSCLEATFQFQPIDGTFPDWRRVIPRAENYDTPVACGFNPSYLADFESFGGSIRLFPNNDPKGPSLFRATTDDFEAFGLLMTLRNGAEDMISHPHWLQPRQEAATTATVGDTEVADVSIPLTTGQPGAINNCAIA